MLFRLADELYTGFPIRVVGFISLALAVTLMISMRAKSFMEAQQMSSVAVIPVLLVAADVVLMTKIGPRFEREAILKTL